MSNREAYLDQLRVVAIIGIVCCHVCCNFILQNHSIYSHFNTFYMLSFFTLGRFIGIPIFIMLSGALLINKNYSFKEFFKKRFDRVFIPYVFWTIIFILFTVLIYHKQLTGELILNIVFGRKGTIGVILWFVWMIIVVYIGIFIINKVLNFGKLKSKNFEDNFINLLIILSLIIYSLCNFGILSFSGELFYYILFIPYAIFGYALTHKEFINSYLTSNRLVILTFLFSLFGYLYFNWRVVINTINTNNYAPGSYFQFIVMLITFSLILFFRYLPKSQFNKVNNFLSSKYVSSAILSISKCSYGIYFIHYLILKFLQNVYLKQIELFDHPKFWTPILLLVVFISSWVIIWILSKIPIINKVSGAV